MWDLKYDWNGKGQNGKSKRDRTWWSSSSLVADVVVPPFRQNDFKTPPPPRCLLLLLNDVVAEALPAPLLDPLLLLDPIFGQMCVLTDTVKCLSLTDCVLQFGFLITMLNESLSLQIYYYIYVLNESHILHFLFSLFVW